MVAALQSTGVGVMVLVEFFESRLGNGVDNVTAVGTTTTHPQPSHYTLATQQAREEDIVGLQL